MATEIRPVNETSFTRSIASDRDRPEREKPTKNEKVLFNEKLSSEEVNELLGELNDVMKVMNTKLSFSVDSATNHPVIQVLDRDSGALIRQIPPEDMLLLSQKINDLLGLLFDERV